MKQKIDINDMYALTPQGFTINEKAKLEKENTLFSNVFTTQNLAIAGGVVVGGVLAPIVAPMVGVGAIATTFVAPVAGAIAGGTIGGIGEKIVSSVGEFFENMEVDKKFENATKTNEYLPNSSPFWNQVALLTTLENTSLGGRYDGSILKSSLENLNKFANVIYATQGDEDKYIKALTLYNNYKKELGWDVEKRIQNNLNNEEIKNKFISFEDSLYVENITMYKYLAQYENDEPRFRQVLSFLEKTNSLDTFYANTQEQDFEKLKDQLNNIYSNYVPSLIQNKDFEYEKVVRKEYDVEKENDNIAFFR